MKLSLASLLGLKPGGEDASRASLTQSTRQKASRTAPYVAFHQPGRGMFTQAAGPALIRAGYHRNAIAYRAVRMVAEAAASVPLALTLNGKEVAAKSGKSHPLETLLARPNSREDGASLFEALYAHLLLSGNAYCQILAGAEGPRELHALRPDRVSILAGADGWPEAYEYRQGKVVTLIPAELGGATALLHIRLHDPLDDHYGFAPLAAAQVALEMHEAASRWNKALLDNSARPSGALVYAAAENLTDDQFDRLKSELESAFSGTTNAGRPVLLEGGLDWKPLSLSPKDMDFMEARAGAAREIALALGVPPLLLGLPGDSTYANYAEANRAFWRSTILPLARRMAGALAHAVQPYYDAEVRLTPDADQIEALAEERAALWARIGAADFLTEEEKRAALGYGNKPPAQP